MRSLTDSELMATNSFHSDWNVFDHTGKVVGQLHGITRGYAEAVMYIKYRGDVTASKGVTYKGKWPKGTFEVSETGNKKDEAFAQKKLTYFRRLDQSHVRRRPKRDRKHDPRPITCFNPGLKPKTGRFVLEAFYRSPHGIDSRIDSQLRNLVGFYEEGSGVDLATYTRDLMWLFDSAKEASTALYRLKKHPAVRQAIVERYPRAERDVHVLSLERKRNPKRRTRK